MVCILILDLLTNAIRIDRVRIVTVDFIEAALHKNNKLTLDGLSHENIYCFTNYPEY